MLSFRPIAQVRAKLSSFPPALPQVIPSNTRSDMSDNALFMMHYLRNSVVTSLPAAYPVLNVMSRHHGSPRHQLWFSREWLAEALRRSTKLQN